ncbi:phosphoesterase [Candidatus Zixiibacteriota bacterium]
MDEQLLCFNRDLLPNGIGDASVFRDDSLWERILANIEIVPRSKAETDYTRKQLVVYVLVRSGDLVLRYRRTQKTDEQRLKELYSIGVGGHVNVGDHSQFSLFQTDPDFNIEFIRDAAWREIDEEVSVDTKILREPELTCFINDDTNDVGKVHFGIVWQLDLSEPAVSVKGTKGIGELEFMLLDRLIEEREQFETWSQLLIDYLSSGESGS